MHLGNRILSSEKKTRVGIRGPSSKKRLRIGNRISPSKKGMRHVADAFDVGTGQGLDTSGVRCANGRAKVASLSSIRRWGREGDSQGGQQERVTLLDCNRLHGIIRSTLKYNLSFL